MKLNGIVLSTLLLIVNLYAVENPEDVHTTIQNGKGLFVLLDDTSWISNIVAEAYILGSIDGIIIRKRPLRSLCGNKVEKALLTKALSPIWNTSTNMVNYRQVLMQEKGENNANSR